MKPTTVVFCFPGSSFTSGFIKSWSRLLTTLPSFNVVPRVAMGESSNIYHVRAICLGGDVLRGRYQEPFNGGLDYDYMMWIDSDQTFTPDDFIKLLLDKKDIVSGITPVSDKALSAGFFDKNVQAAGKSNCLTFEELQEKKEPFEVDYTGFAFLLVKRGVFESLEYPWFMPIKRTLDNGVIGVGSEDVSWCHHVKSKGYRIWVDPYVRVGHQKRITLNI